MKRSMSDCEALSIVPHGPGEPEPKRSQMDLPRHLPLGRPPRGKWSEAAFITVGG